MKRCGVGNVLVRACAGLAFVCLAAISLAGCASDALREKDGRLYVKWTEEVQLSDGRVIIAERSDEYEKVSDRGSGLGRGGWLYRRGSFKATLPDPISKTVSWEGTLQPLVLDVFGGQEVYFVGRVAAARDLDEWKITDREAFRDPSAAYVIFRLSTEGWQRVSLRDLPQAAKPNFLADTRQFFEEEKALVPGTLVVLSAKRKIDSDGRLIKELRMIVRPTSAAK